MNIGMDATNLSLITWKTEVLWTRKTVNMKRMSKT